MPASSSDLVAAFLANGGVIKTCPTRKALAPVSDGAVWDTAEQPVPTIGKVRRIVGDERRARASALAARIARGI